MTDDNLVLIQLAAIRSELGEMKAQQDEQFQSIQLALHGLSQNDQTRYTENIKINHDVQELARRINRIEQCLEPRDQ